MTLMDLDDSTCRTKSLGTEWKEELTNVLFLTDTY